MAARKKRKRKKAKREMAGYSPSPPKKIKKIFSSFKKKKAIITFHSLADLDACASALVLAQELGNAEIGMPDRINSESKRVLGKNSGKFLKFLELRKKFPKAKIILLDCNEKSLLPHLHENEADVLIDHHALQKNSVDAKIKWINPEASSTSEMIGELVKNPDAFQAKMLVLGILSDSANLANANAGTFSVLSKLLSKCNESYEAMHSMLRIPRSVESRMRVLEGLRNINFMQKGGIICAIAQVSSNESHVADAFIRAGADGAFVGAAGRNSARVSARVKQRMVAHIDLPKLMGEVGKIIGGGGGGHPAAAGATGANPQKLGEALALAQKLFFRHTTARIKI
ncbi:MAG: DHH family phosphoesterase [Candidatus Micrarchaeota archaeon]